MAARFRVFASRESGKSWPAVTLKNKMLMLNVKTADYQKKQTYKKRNGGLIY